VVFILTSIGYYNGFVSSNQKIEAAMSEIDNQQQRRSDLVPNLVNTVKGYASHEKEVFENIAKARQMYSSTSSTSDKIKADQEMSSSLSRLIAVAENYPELKSDKHFTDLMTQLEGTENRLSVARKNYNDSVKKYNSKISRFPGNVFAKMYGVYKQPYFKADEAAKSNPVVDFNNNK
jgi:LemA protein